MEVKRSIGALSLLVLMAGTLSWATETSVTGESATRPTGNAVVAPTSAAEAGASKDAAAPPPIPPEFLKMLQIGAKYDDFKPQEWTSVPFPSAGDTVDPELGGVRESLKKHGIGIMVYPQVSFDINMIDAPMFGANGAYTGSNPSKRYSDPLKGTAQAYSGQRPTYYGNSLAWLTMNRLSTGTQFVISAYEFPTNWASGSTVEGVYVTGLYVNQYFWKKKALLSVGWGQQDAWETYGIYVHGNMAVPLIGVGAIGSAEAGLATPMVSAPSSSLRVNWSKRFYTVNILQRSVEIWNTNADNTKMNHNALYMPFRQPGAKAILLQEFDYKRQAAPGTKDLWVRLTGVINASHYFDYRKGGDAFALAFYDWSTTGTPEPLHRHHFHKDTPEQLLLSNEALLHMPVNPYGKVLTDNNWQICGAADAQLTQDKFLPFRGWYGGFTASYLPPQQNIFSQYYEARAYDVGPFKNRPIDQFTVAVGVLQMSRVAARMIAKSQSQSGMYANTYNTTQVSIAPSFTSHLHSGVWASAGVQYCVHPTIAPKVPNPLVLRTNISMFW